MSFELFIPLTADSAPSKVERTWTPTVRQTNFEGNYNQRRPAGINSTLIKARFSFEHITKAEAQDMMDFFARKRGATPFLFTAPGESTPRKWVATEWSFTPRNAFDNDVVATFEEVVNPG